MPSRKLMARPQTTDLCDVCDALLYMAATGCQWAMISKDFPPPSTVLRYFYDWRDGGLWATINHHLVMAARELKKREASSIASMTDSQSVCPKRRLTKTVESGGVRGYDAGKKIKGRKHHNVTDTLGLLIGFLIHDVQGRGGASNALKTLRRRFPRLHHIFADGAYAGPKLRESLYKIGEWVLEIFKRSDTAKRFQVLGHRWVIKRTFAWLGRCRTLAKDWEKSIASA